MKAKTQVENSIALSPTVPLTEDIRLTKWIAPSPVTKRLGLDADGELVKLSTANQLYEGEVMVLSTSATNFPKLLADVQDNECFSYGIPIDSTVHRVLSGARYADAGKPAGSMTRTAEKMSWSQGPAILMLDYDPEAADTALDQNELLNALYGVCPALADSAHIWVPSTSSCLYDKSNGKEVRGVRGQRVYVIVANGADIPRAGSVLSQRLWSAGFGHIKISKAGSQLVRSIVDPCVWQTNRIDYVAPPICEHPLESRKPPPVILGNVDCCLNSKVALPDLTADELAACNAIVSAAKAATEAEAREVREHYIAERIQRLVDDGMPYANAEATIRAAVETTVLHADFVLETTAGTFVSVGEILANKDRYHNATFADPLEPDYHDDKRIARARLLGVATPYIWSYAHGGQKFRLMPQKTTMLIVKGQRGSYMPKIANELDKRDLAFSRGSSLVGIGDDGHLVTRTKHSTLALMDETIHFEQLTKKGPEPMDAPLSWSDLLSGGHLEHFRPINSVLTAPIIVPSSGRVIQTAGYDLEQKIFVINADIFAPIPEAPSLSEVQAALAAIWYPISQFPFCSGLDQTVMVTAMLTAVVRKFLPTSPGIGFDAPVQGSGKTLLLKVLAALTGETPTISPQPDSMRDDEMRKRIFAMLREGKNTIVIDNIVGNFDSASLAAAITSVSYSDRVLGESRSETVPNMSLVLLSGNNLRLMGDLPRRVLTCRIDPKIESPHARSFAFDPEQLVTDYRQELVAAAITLMLAFKQADIPERIGAGRMASFEVWDDLVRQTICWLAKLQAEGALPIGNHGDSTYPELSDPLLAVNAAVAQDPKRERQAILLTEMAKHFGFGTNGNSGPVFTTNDLYLASNPMRNSGYIGANYAISNPERDLEDVALFDAIVEVGGDSVGRRINKRSLGKYLASIKDQVVGGLVLREGKKQQRYSTWWLEHLGSEFGELSEFVLGKTGNKKTNIRRAA